MNFERHRLLAAGLLLLGLLGCGGGDPSPASHPPGVLRVGTPMKVRVANPLVDYSYNIFAMLATHDTLVRFDGAMKPYPQLASSWQASPDGRRWQFRLRDDACWHDGRPVTPGDVKFTFEYLAAHHGASAWMRTLIDDIRVQGQKIVFDLAKPHSRFLINCGFIVRILPRHIWETVTDPFKPGDARVTLGCGPFVFQDFDSHANRLVFSRNEAYYGALPAIQELSISLNRSFDALALSLRRGDLDLYYKYASGFPPSHLAVLSSAQDLHFPEAVAMGVPAALGFNFKHRPTHDIEFRRAVAAALDYERLTASLTGIHGKLPDRGFLPSVFGHGPTDTILVHSPEESRLRLDRAGYTDTNGDGLRNWSEGGNITLTLLARADLEGTDALLPILSHNLKQVGLSLKIERADLSTWIERVHSERFDLVLFRTTPWGMVMDAGAASGYFDSRRHGGGTLSNVADPAFHDLCDRLLATTDPVRQADLHKSIRRYYAENLPAVALCWTVNAYPVGYSWQGLTINQIEGGLLNRQTFATIHRSTPEKQEH